MPGASFFVPSTERFTMRMFDALLPYFGNKRKLCSLIFSYIHKYFPRDKWNKMIFVDVFLGSGAVSLFAKAQGFKVIGNDISKRSEIAGRALIENNGILLTEEDIQKLFIPNAANNHLIETEYVPEVFLKRHAVFLDNAFANAKRPLDKYLLVKTIFRLRPFSKFSSPNAFNLPMEEGRYDEIKGTYTKHIEDNLKSVLEILRLEKDRINAGIFSNGLKNEVSQDNAFDFISKVSGDVLYLDPPYSGTLAYENEYSVLDKILGDDLSKSKFSEEDGMDMLDTLLARAEKFSLWVISFGNAAGKNDLNKLTAIVSKYRKCDSREFNYKHCEAMASEAHKKGCKEWLLMGYK